MATRFGKVVTKHKGLSLTKLLDLSITRFATYQILYISTCTRPMASKHGKMETLCKGTPLVSSHNPLNP